MKPRHQISRAAIELIERFEGYRSKAARLPDGRWTIGYGHTQSARDGAEVSQADAEALLIYDLIAVAHAVNELTFTPLTQNQFDALCAFAFNIGLENFRTSTVLRRVNEGQLLQAACAMELWRKADFEGERIVIDALVRRRAAEKALFLTPPGGFIPVPSPILRPNLDLDVAGAVPREAPTALTTPMDGAEVRVEREASEVPEGVEEGPSATEAAAAAVSARLAAIFADEDETPAEGEAAPMSEAAEDDSPVAEIPLEDPTPPAPEARVAVEETQPELPAFQPLEPVEPVQTAEPAAAEQAPVELERLVLAEPANDTVAEPEPVAAAETTTAEDFPRILNLEPEADEDAPVARERPRFNYLPLLGLAAVGGAIFGGGIFWSVSAQGAAGGAWALGWFAALLGIVLMGRAAYLFLERLGQIGGGLGDEGYDRD